MNIHSAVVNVKNNEKISTSFCLATCVTINSCYETHTFVDITKFHLVRAVKKE